MTSVTTWNRLEPQVRGNDLRENLEARLHDPLWSMARQWQLGEFKGEDAGSPVRASYEAEITQLTRFHAGPLEGRTLLGERYHSDREPLESRVERESNFPSKASDANDRRTAMQLAEQFLAGLQKRLGSKIQVKYRKRFIEKLEMGFKPEKDTPFAVALLEKDGVDGRVLYAYLKKYLPEEGKEIDPDNPLLLELGADERKAHAKVFTELGHIWLQRVESLLPETDNKGSWQDRTLSYDFSVSAPGPGQEETLLQAEYPGGHLDWYSFDIATQGGLKALPGDLPAGFQDTVALSLIPEPVSFAGMPSERWWEFEDGRVNLPAMSVGRNDLARLIFLEFSLVYGNDWFLIPLDLPVGSLCRIKRLQVRDTFGDTYQVGRLGQGPGTWRMFALSDDDGGASREGVLLLPPSLGRHEQSEPFEEVHFMRDEQANLAWAIERKVKQQSGAITDRAEAYRAKLAQQVEDAEPQSRREYLYELATDVPDYWYPMVPEREGGNPEGALLLRRGLVRDTSGQLQTRPQGDILNRGKAFVVDEETIPRAGAEIRRQQQFARWIDGSNHHWLSRHKKIGKGEGSSDLNYDQLK
jgi:hypothetical protein